MHVAKTRPVIYIGRVRWLCFAVALTAPLVPGCKCAKDGDAPAAASPPPTSASAAPAAAAIPAKPEVVVDELKKNAASLRFSMRISPQLNGRLDPKISLYELQFGAAGKPKTDGRVGPSLKPIADAAQLTPDEVTALLAWFGKAESLSGVVMGGAPPPGERHASMTFGWDGQVNKYVVYLPWTAEASTKFEAVRAALSDEHKKMVDVLLKPVPR